MCKWGTEEHFLLVVAVFIQHSLCNCQLQAQEKGVKSFPLLIELCERRKERLWERRSEWNWEGTGFSRYCAVLLTSSGHSKHNMCSEDLPGMGWGHRSSQKEQNQMAAIFVSWAALQSSQSGVVTTT